jgi:hypothetical protein
MLQTVFMIDEVITPEDEVYTVRRTGQLPFVPEIGTEIACGDGDDFRVVSCVQWHAGEQVLYVTFEVQDGWALHMVLDQGWEVCE